MSKNRNNEKRISRGLVASAIVSVLLAIAVSLGVFSYFFVDFRKSESISVPDLVGKRAEDIPPLADFKIRKQYVSSDSVERGIVISQSPTANSRKKRLNEKHIIDLVVSLGKEELYMPSLDGEDCALACSRLRSMGMRVRVVPIYFRCDEISESDIVQSTSPRANAPLQKGDTVTLFVNRVERIKTVSVKNYNGFMIEEACLDIMSQGLSVGDISLEYSNEAGEGTVIFQSLPEGALVLEGSIINLTVSQGEGLADIDINQSLIGE